MLSKQSVSYLLAACLLLFAFIAIAEAAKNACQSGVKSEAKTTIKAAKSNATAAIKVVKSNLKTLLKVFKTYKKEQTKGIKASASSLSVYCPGLSGKSAKKCANFYKAALIIVVKVNASIRVLESKSEAKKITSDIKSYFKCQKVQAKAFAKCQWGNCLSSKTPSQPFDCSVLSLGCPANPQASTATNSAQSQALVAASSASCN